MSSKMNWSGSIQRFLKGDLDPANLFGRNPSRQDLRENQADRRRRATQIEFEKGNPELRAAGGSIDPATQQRQRLRYETQSYSFSPFAPPDPISLTANIMTESTIRAARGELTGTGGELTGGGHTPSGGAASKKKKRVRDRTRLSDRQIRRSVLGPAR